MESTPVSLLLRVQRFGRADDWARLVDFCSPLLYSWSRRKGLSDQDAADLVQEVFAQLVRALPRFEYDPQKTFRGWLRTVAQNKWRERRRRRVPQALPYDTFEDLAQSREDDPYWEVEYRRELVARALEVMQSQFQTSTWKACLEHVLSGRPAAAIAAELGMSEGAVYVAKSRVLRRLRQELEGLIE